MAWAVKNGYGPTRMSTQQHLRAAPTPVPVVLASGSRYRRELLARILPHFEVVPPAVDESAPAGEPAAATAARLSRLKAETVARQLPGAIVIGSDQIAECDGRTLGKPGSVANAVTQLAACAGRVLTLHTGVHVTGPGNRAGIAHLDQTHLEFRALTLEEIRRYVDRDRPLDCAGSFRFEALGAALFAGVQTRDPFAIEGLPLLWLTGALVERGVQIL